MGVRVALGLATGMLVWSLPCETQNAVANGDTRTIHLVHAHTHESIDATYLVEGSYDSAVLDKLNWFLRDWRRDEPTKMDPKLFDVIWEVYRDSGSRQPIEVMSAYRSPETNAMLRRRSRAVAEHSQHILGKAMDQHYMDVPMSKIREIAMRLQGGGVGFYPTAGTPFVHMDVGGVRHWPRMSYDQLARLFPDGKTVHIPSNGQPLPGYELARAELESRGGASYPSVAQIKSKGFFAWLFGSGDEDEDAAADGGRSARATASASRNTRFAMASAGRAMGEAAYDPTRKDDGSRSFFASQQSSAPSASSQASVSQAPTPDNAPVAASPPPAPTIQPQEQLALAMAMKGAAPQAASGQQTRPTNLAVAELAVPAVTLAQNGLVPTPPRRPVELAEAALPMPPIRPAELSRPIEGPAPSPAAARLARADSISALLNMRGAGLSDAAERRPAGALLAYAGDVRGPVPTTNVPLPVARPADLVGARLDRVNFRSLTSLVKTDKAPGQASLGATVVGVRAASRARLGTYAEATKVVTTFGSKASDLSTDKFSGSAVKGQERLITARRLEPGTRSSPD